MISKLKFSAERRSRERERERERERLSFHARVPDYPLAGAFPNDRTTIGRREARLSAIAKKSREQRETRHGVRFYTQLALSLVPLRHGAAMSGIIAAKRMLLAESSCGICYKLRDESAFR